MAKLVTPRISNTNHMLPDSGKYRRLGQAVNLFP
jgi:hypothetical protein